jgi:hypothetical protein
MSGFPTPAAASFVRTQVSYVASLWRLAVGFQFSFSPNHHSQRVEQRQW